MEGSAAIKKLMEQDLPALNKKMNEAGVPHIVPKAEGGAKGGEEEEWD